MTHDELVQAAARESGTPLEIVIPFAAAYQRLRASAGGRSASERLTPEERRERARRAAMARRARRAA